ncbi:hypothetical protein HH214_08025 [Mucilaginibacter robiniae]|uniref:Uncharacterized protein n=1 Tax=Mucilaginibacter robiniae TaxID=2728022 RepID=A0A7L5DXI4_9SPHI|nr:hypothetical protein [Mucilaginibacter robiniae]QJD95822.1 hypothetical protein HH214_08025 [Mucilaginibacter robiniae]
MKRKLTAAALSLILTTLLNSCFLRHDSRGLRADRGRHYPHDEPKQ